MKVVHVIWSFTTGGTECRLIDQLNALASELEQVLIVINNHYEPELLCKIDKRVRVICLSRPISSKNPYYYYKLNRIIALSFPDVLISHVASISRVIYKKNCPLLLHLHGIKEKIDGYLENYDGFITISRSVADYILSHGDKNSPIVVYNGINFDRFEKRQSKKYKMDRKFKIIKVGRLVDEVKGQTVLLKAMHRCEKYYGFENWELFFVGDGTSKASLIDLSKNLGITGKTHFLGNKSPEFLYKNLKNFDLAILSSHREGLGNTIIEAMAAKVPILVSDLPGPMEVIACGRYGKKFNCGDYVSCSDEIYKCYSNYTSYESQKLVNDAYFWAKNNFEIKVMVKKLSQIYKKFSGLSTKYRLR